MAAEMPYPASILGRPRYNLSPSTPPFSALSAFSITSQDTAISNSRISESSKDKPLELWFSSFGNGQDVIATLVDLGHRLPMLEGAWSTHMTLVDLQPCFSARIILILSALYDWGRDTAKAGKKGAGDSLDHAAYTTHLMASTALPKRYLDRVKRDMKLFNAHQLPVLEVLQIDPVATTDICEIYDHWLSDDCCDGLLEALDARIQETIEAQSTNQEANAYSVIRTDLKQWQKSLRLTLAHSLIHKYGNNPQYYGNPLMVSPRGAENVTLPHPFLTTVRFFEGYPCGFEPLLDFQSKKSNATLKNANSLCEYLAHVFAKAACALSSSHVRLQMEVQNPCTALSSRSLVDSAPLDRVIASRVPEKEPLLTCIIATVPKLSAEVHAGLFLQLEKK